MGAKWKMNPYSPVKEAPISAFQQKTKKTKTSCELQQIPSYLLKMVGWQIRWKGMETRGTGEIGSKTEQGRGVAEVREAALPLICPRTTNFWACTLPYTCDINPILSRNSIGKFIVYST